MDGMSERLRLTITCDIDIEPGALGIGPDRTAEMALGRIGSVAIHGALENESGVRIVAGVSANAVPA